MSDAINAPLLRFAIGSIEKLGLKRSAKGPLRSIEEDGRVPLIDIGTLDAIRHGRIKLRGDVASLAGESVVFKHSPAERFDAIILATGFRPDLRPLLPDAKGVLTATGAPLVSGRATAEPGLLLLRRHSLGDRTISADRHRSDPHRQRGAVKRSRQPGIGVSLKLCRFCILVHQSSKPSTFKAASLSGVSDT